MPILRLSGCALLAALACSSIPAAAQSDTSILHQVTGGLLAHDVPIWASHRKEEGLDLNAGLVFALPLVDLLGGTIRPYTGASVSLSGDTSRVAAGLVWQAQYGSMFLDLGLGGAVHNGKLDHAGPDRKNLGSRLLFHIPVEVGVALDAHHRIGLYFEHFSNAYLADPNPGIDAFGLRYTYQF